MFHEYPKAMHGPDKGFAVVRDEAEEKALRSGGWIDGHEFWSAKRDEAEKAVEAVAHQLESAVVAPFEKAEEAIAEAAEKVSAKLRKKKVTADGAV